MLIQKRTRKYPPWGEGPVVKCTENRIVFNAKAAKWLREHSVQRVEFYPCGAAVGMRPASGLASHKVTYTKFQATVTSREVVNLFGLGDSKHVCERDPGGGLHWTRVYPAAQGGAA